MEFASMFSGFGSDVTVIQDGETFLPREDEDIAGEIKAILEKSGVKFRLGAKIKYVDEGPKVVFEWNKQDYSLESDAVLAATGRIPNTSELNCQAAGIEVNPRASCQGRPKSSYYSRKRLGYGRRDRRTSAHIYIP